MLKSKINSNTYELFEDRIEVTTRNGKKTIPLPQDDNGNNICFWAMYYTGRTTLRVFIACRVGFDVQYVIDEESLELTQKTPYKM